jgi:hypothetical protein
MVRGIKILLVLLLTFSSCAVVAQEKIGGIFPCVDSVINASHTHTIYTPVKVKITGKKAVLKGDNTRDTFGQEKVLSWIDKVEKDSIRAYELKNAEYKSYILSSFIKQATGLGSNFTSWLIIIPKSNTVFEFESLAQNHRLIYFNKETSKLNFVRFTYGEYFFWKRDWDNVDFKIELNEIDNGESKVISSTNSWCSQK